MTRLSLTTLGTGTAMPDAMRGTSAYLIRHGDQSILVDIGDGTLQKLHAAGGHILSLDALIITHAHLDHLAGLFPLLFALHVPAFARSKPLDVFLSKETMTLVEQTQEVFGSWLKPGDDRIVFHTLDIGETVDICGLRMSVHAVCHDVSSVGLRFVSPEGIVIAIPADTGPCATLTALCQGADLAVLECGVPDALSNDMHLAPSEVAALANAAQVTHVVVVHRYMAAHRADVVGTIRAQFSGITTAAEDGQVFELPPIHP